MSFITKWIKTGKAHDLVFLGKEVIATASGNHVIFFNLITKEDRIEYFNSVARGDGACCLAGHSIIPVFSTVERCHNPKIYIHTYPEIRKVAVCRLDNGLNAYISCNFSGTEYLLSLTSFPNFQLIVWLWRTGEKMTCIDTTITEENQTIDVSLNTPHLVYQFSSASGKILTYEIYTCSKKVTLIKNTIKSIENKIICICWTNSGSLILCDRYKNVYIASIDGKKLQVILIGNKNNNSECKVLILPFCNGFVIVDSDSQLNCYNKSFSENNLNENWYVVWSIKCPSQPIKMTQARHKEAILFSTESGKIYELHLRHDNKPELEEIYNNCRKFKLMCSLKPQEIHCVLIDIFNSLNILNIYDGSIRSSFEINKEDEVLCIATHPYIPLLGISTSSGKCIFFTVSTEELSIFKMFHLQRQPLNKIKFSKSGTLLGVVSIDPSNIFLLKTDDDEIMIFFHKKIDKTIVDFLIYENGEIIQLFILIKTFPSVFIGNCIEIYCIRKSENCLFKNYTICMPNYYQNIFYGLDKDYDFLGSPYLSKQLHFFKIEDNYESFVFVNAISSEHKLRKFYITNSHNALITSGYDGSVILRNSLDLSTIITNVKIHHYQERGCKNSILSSCGKTIVSLGRNGSVIGFICRDTNEEFDNVPLKDSEILTLMRKETNAFSFCQTKIWIEEEELKVIQKEISKALDFKNMILIDLSELKSKIREMLNLNETKTSEFQLPVSSFDLNTKLREEKINTALKKQEERKLYLQERLDVNEKIIDYMTKNFWDPFEVHDCTLISFNCKTYINNYSLRHIEKQDKMDDFSIELFNTPLPNLLIEHANDQSSLDFEVPTSETLDENFDKANDNIFLKYNDDIVYNGSTSFKWIEDDIPQNQLSKMVFDQNDYDIINCRENKLKIYFNKKFSDMQHLKNNILQTTSDRLKILEKCTSELKNVYNVVLEIDNFANIKIHSIESQENVITITEEDILSVIQNNSYLNNEDIKEHNDISNTLNVKSVSTVETEAAFRKGKIKEMMDGVLEIRWEDEIRKEISKPDCLLLKHPSNYSKEDIQAIEVYKKKVEKLEIERQKYKVHLETKISRINEQIKSDIQTFDKKMENFALDKIQIQSAILQEFLLRLNERKRQLHIECVNKRIFCLVNNDLVLLENEYKTFTSDLSNMETVIIELKNKYENLNKRDKALEGKFRTEFSELKQPMVEHLLRQYKRRPRIGQIICTSLTCLLETNKCLMAGKKSTILPREYLDFLRGMDSLDVMPNSLPAQIDASHWQSLCRLRRNKVEMEIKLRIAVLELAEAEQTYFYMQKLGSSLQSKIYFMKNMIEEETLKKSKILNNPDIQLVLKTAQIEMYTTGHSNDFENATVVTYERLIEVNNKIRKVGEKKINAMQTLIKLKKSILFRDWKYQCMFKKLKHLKEHLTVLQKAKIGKEIQDYLIERLEGKHRYKDATSSKRMLQSVQKKFERMLEEEKINLLRTISRIKYWRKKNDELITTLELLSLKQQEQISNLEEDHLRERNKVFRRNYLLSIMERTRLVGKVKENHDELLNLQTQLELLKLRTYPTLRFKDVSCCKRSNFLKKHR